MTYLLVALGGGLGAVARYALGAWIVSRIANPFPFHTLLINATGSLAIGLLLGLFAGRPPLDSAWRLFLVVGFLGGYTTFSTYSFEAITLAREGGWAAAAWYVLGSNGLSLLACALGIALAHAVSTARG